MMRVMTLQTVRRGEGLILMSLLQSGILDVVTVQTKGGGRFGEMEFVIRGRFRSGFVSQMTSVASDIQCGMVAPFFGDVQARLVATEAKIFFCVAREWLEELILVIRAVWIVAGKAIADGGRMNRSLYLRRLHVRVARETES